MGSSAAHLAAVGLTVTVCCHSSIYDRRDWCRCKRYVSISTSAIENGGRELIAKPISSPEVWRYLICGHYSEAAPILPSPTFSAAFQRRDAHRYAWTWNVVFSILPRPAIGDGVPRLHSSQQLGSYALPRQKSDHQPSRSRWAQLAQSE